MICIKILWFNHRDIKHPKSGGAEKTIFEVSKRLIQRGIEIKLYSVTAGSLPKWETESGIQIVRFPNNLIAHLMIPIILGREKHDVVVDDMAHAIPWGSENFTHSKGTVFFRHLHRRSLRGQVSPPARFLISGVESVYPLIYRKWPFVTESESSIRDLHSLGIGTNRILKIPPGLDGKDFKVFDKTKAPSIVYYGGLRDYKRPWEPLYIVKELLKFYPNIHLFMVGSGPALETVKSISNSIGVAQYVTFTGRLIEEDLKEMVGRAWVNLHCSITEGFGLSIIESAAVGTPTIAYKVSGVNEVVEDGKNGILVEDGNRVQMSESVLKVLQQYPGHWVSSSIDSVRKYSWDKTAAIWEKHLRNLCE